jgi:2,3-bisphosphoglycerate-dependent phosphoglycerate mutase
MTTQHTLILLRHGNSTWNQKNLFTGWVDVDLSDQGRQEAKRAGELLAESGLEPDLLYTSLLKRAINTANIALDAADRGWIDVKRSWRLNERHYGALQGKDKAQTLETYGPEQFQLWRRSFDVPPPPIDDGDEYSQSGDKRYQGLGSDLVPVLDWFFAILLRQPQLLVMDAGVPVGQSPEPLSSIQSQQSWSGYQWLGEVCELNSNP